MTFNELMEDATRARAKAIMEHPVTLFARFTLAVGRGAYNRLISLPGRIKEAVTDAVVFGAEMANDPAGTWNRTALNIGNGVASTVSAVVSVASDPQGTYDKAMDKLAEMGPEAAIDALGEAVGGGFVDFYTGKAGDFLRGKALGAVTNAVGEYRAGKAGAQALGEARDTVRTVKGLAQGNEIARDINLAKNTRFDAWKNDFGKTGEGYAQLVKDLPKWHPSRTEFARMLREIRTTGGAIRKADMGATLAVYGGESIEAGIWFRWNL